MFISKIRNITVLVLTLHLLLVTQACAVLPHAAGSNLVKADNSHIQYTGRVAFNESKEAVISWPGTYVKFNFLGSDIAVTLDDQYGKNYFSAFIDEDFDNPVILDLDAGEKTYPIATGLKQGKHSLMLYKRTEGEEGRTQLKSFTLSEGGKLLRPPARPKRRIEFYGDSITSGMGNEAALEAADDVLAEKNNFLSYSSIAARKLNAEYVTVSQSGIGIMVSWFDFIMPNFYDQLSAVGDNDSQWDFSEWTPQVVVVNLFQNDSWLVEKRLSPVPNEEQRIQAYMDFISSIRERYPAALIVATLGSMDATKKGSPWPGYIEEAISRLQNTRKDENLAVLFFPFEEYGRHPRVQHHQKNAERLASFIEGRMGDSW